MTATGYSVEESLRAKCVRVKVSLYDARVVVVVPRGFDRSEIPQILREKQSWIERTQRKVNEQRTLAGTNGGSHRPDNMLLRAIDEEWGVEYDPAPRRGLSLREHGEATLLLRGEVDDPVLYRHALQLWVRDKARLHLVPWLERVSREQELPASRLTVRAQRSRWGSCSRQRAISINQKLLFLPPALVRYVFIHELCHMVHFDHSPAFWRLVTQREPRGRALDDELGVAWRYVPVWMGA